MDLCICFHQLDEGCVMTFKIVLNLSTGKGHEERVPELYNYLGSYLGPSSWIFGNFSSARQVSCWPPNGSFNHGISYLALPLYSFSISIILFPHFLPPPSFSVLLTFSPPFPITPKLAIFFGDFPFTRGIHLCFS